MKGSLRKKRGRKWYTLVIDLGYLPGPDGALRRKQKFLTLTGIDNRQDAQAKQAEILAKFNGGGFVEPSKLTLGEWLDDWHTKKSTGWAPATVANYRAIIGQWSMAR